MQFFKSVADSATLETIGKYSDMYNQFTSQIDREAILNKAVRVGMGDKKTLYALFRKGCKRGTKEKEKRIPAIEYWKDKDRRELAKELESQKRVVECARDTRHRNIFEPVYLECGCQYDCDTLYSVQPPARLPDEWNVL